MSRILVVGGGAAGMYAAAAAAERGHAVTLYEKNEKLGKKLFITGKGRCNLTNACDMETLFASVVSNPKFLYSSFYGHTNQDTVDWFEREGLRTKTERGNRVFPVSDHSSDVIRTLERKLKRAGAEVRLRAEVKEIGVRDGRFAFLRLADGTKESGDACIIATGGLSYSQTGSTGDGYRFAECMGHSVAPCIPSLVPMEVKESWVGRLQGLSLRNVQVSVYNNEKKQIFSEFGEMLFTHFGVSGPVILSASSYVGRALAAGGLTLEIDLKPALDAEALDRRVLRDFEENQNRRFKNSLGKLFPSKLIPVITELSGIGAEKKVNVVSREERAAFVYLIKHLRMTLTALRGFDEAVITKGGIRTKEIDPATMESKLVRGIYFAGEVLDVDALTGGFNLQIAWSTGYAAGTAAGENREES